MHKSSVDSLGLINETVKLDMCHSSHVVLPIGFCGENAHCSRDSYPVVL